MTNKTKKKARSQQKDFKDYARYLGSRGGKKRSENLSAERRTEIAKKAATARWAIKKKT